MKNEIKVFGNDAFNVKVKIDLDGNYMFDAESVATSLGLTERKGNKEYVMWRRVNQYLKLFGTSAEIAKGSYIPEPAVYKLTFKASNEVAENFQDWLAVEVLPTLRKTGSYEMSKKERPKREKLSSANMMAKNIKDALSAAGVEPVYIAAEVTRIYTDLGFPVTAHLPVAIPVLWDCTGMAKELGVMSKSNRPHDKAISAIIQRLDITENEIVKTAYSRNGHDGVTVQYADSVFQKVKNWLEDHDYPKEITLLLANGNINACQL